jgi:hypothetical protein
VCWVSLKKRIKYIILIKTLTGIFYIRKKVLFIDVNIKNCKMRIPSVKQTQHSVKSDSNNKYFI